MHTSMAHKSSLYSNTDNLGEQRLADAIQVARQSITAPSTVIVMKESHVWAKRRADIRSVCAAAFTDEEIGLYECKALTSWESR